jgi:hypothetical protein
MTAYRHPVKRQIELVSIGLTSSLYRGTPSKRDFVNVLEVWNRHPVFLEQISMGTIMTVRVNLTFC